MANKETRILAIEDHSGRNKDITFERNYNSFSRKKGLIKITIGDTTAVVSKEHLWSILFMLGNHEEQDKLVSPFVQRTPVHSYHRVIGITTTRDVRKGEAINVMLAFTFNPETGEISIGKGNKRSFIPRKN